MNIVTAQAAIAVIAVVVVVVTPVCKAFPHQRGKKADGAHQIKIGCDFIVEAMTKRRRLTSLPCSTCSFTLRSRWPKLGN